MVINEKKRTKIKKSAVIVVVLQLPTNKTWATECYAQNQFRKGSSTHIRYFGSNLVNIYQKL